MMKVALVGLSQHSFPGDKAGRFRKCREDLTTFLKSLDASLYTYPETVVTPEDAVRALGIIGEQKPDFLLVQCTSFSVGLLSQIFATSGYPVGFWAIPEGTNTGVVPFNSFCAVNMYQSIVRNYFDREQIPVKWFFGEVNSELFAPRLAITIRALRAIKTLRSSKIALIGGIVPGFNDLYFDERKLLRLFPGMQYNRLHEFSEIADRARSYSESEIAELADAIDGAASGVAEGAKPYRMLNARFLRAYRDFLAEYGYDAIAISCWPKFQTEFDYSICSVVSQLNDDGTPAACEGDVLGAVSMLMLKALSSEPTMLMDISSFDVSDDSVLLWHCGAAASSFADGGYTLSVNYHGKAHTEQCPLNSCGVTRDMVFRPREVTVGRLAGECDELLVVGGRILDPEKPSFCGSRGWLGDIELTGERICVRDLINTILSNGLPHHYPVVAGRYQDELMEIAAWLKIKPVERLEYRPYLQRG